MIIELDNTLISTEIFSKHFVCHIEKCKGACCIEGDRGAPLDADELPLIAKNIEAIKPYMTPEGLALLNNEGFHEGTEIDDPATTCLPTGECVFAYRDEQQALGCAIEKAWQAGESDFRKPISCHLYPIRIGKAGDFETINYHEWDICKAACSLGNELNIPLFKFLKAPLIRKYGSEWYTELEQIEKEFSAFQS
ncbi:MAG: DUF3109 family protein [Bacteroidota bacterium]